MKFCNHCGNQLLIGLTLQFDGQNVGPSCLKKMCRETFKKVREKQVGATHYFAICCVQCGDKVHVGVSIYCDGKNIGPYCPKKMCQEAFSLEFEKCMYKLFNQKRLCIFQKQSGTCGMTGSPAVEHGLCATHFATKCFGHYHCQNRIAAECLDPSCILPVCVTCKVCASHPVPIELDIVL